MPVRGQEEPKTKKAAKPKGTKAAKKEEETPSVESVTAPEPKEAKSTQTVQKYIVEEKAKKYLKEVGVDTLIFETHNSVVSTVEGDKINVCFITFAESGADSVEVDDAFNISVIKDVLFAYHTVPEHGINETALVIEVLPPKEGEDTPHILCFQE